MSDQEHKMAWKVQYAKNRRAKMAVNPEYAAKRKSVRSRTVEENKLYMAEYYRNNPDKFKRNNHNNEQRNIDRRKRYAEDAAFREKCKLLSKSVCKNRKKSNRIKIAFGIDLDEYNRILCAQNGECAICGARKASARGENLHIDHCHQTGQVRGLLCANCNQGLGKFADDPARLMKAISYLRAESKTKGAFVEQLGPATDLLARAI